MNFRPGIVYFWNFRPGILNSRPDYVFFSNFSMGNPQIPRFYRIFDGVYISRVNQSRTKPIFFPYKTNILEIERRKKKVFENSKLTRRRPIINPY